jgi:uncharacterized protein (DUF3084 family)
MDRATAIRKLVKILGTNMGYRVDPMAPTQGQREEASAALRAARQERDALEEQRAARLKEILAADAEYQRIKAEHAAAVARLEKLAAIARHYKFTVGVSNSMFFAVRAEGDSWEQVIAKLTEKTTV